MLKNAIVWADVWELALSWWRVIRLRRLVFLLLLCTIQNSLLCVVLVVRLRHVQFFRKNRQSFSWKCFVRKQLLLDLAHLETPIQSTAVYFRAHTRKFTIHHLSLRIRRVSKPRNRIFGAFLSTNRHDPFFERFTVKCSCNIECMLVPLMVSGTTTDFRRPSQNSTTSVVDDKPGFNSQARHQNEIQKILLRRVPLSRLLAKTLRVNKIAMKSLLKNLSFGVDFKL